MWSEKKGEPNMIKKGEPNMMKNMTLKKGKQKMILKKVNQSLVELPAPVSCPPSPPLW